MKYSKATFAVLIFTTLIFTITSCKNEIKKIDIKEDIEENKVETKAENIQKYALGSQVPNNLVCMVNNAYMGKPQIPVPVNGKTYYGCCQMCVGTLTNDKTARMAVDPYSHKPVDKTEAYIVLIKAEGEVSYFESKENYLNYIKKS